MLKGIYEKGGEIVGVSTQLHELVIAASSGMTDVQVERATGLTYATWRRLKNGGIISPQKIIQFANALELDSAPFLEAANKAKPSLDLVRLLSEVLTLSPLTQQQRVEMVQLYQKLIHEKQSKEKQAA
jgi:hypothetical protein